MAVQIRKAVENDFEVCSELIEQWCDNISLLLPEYSRNRNGETYSTKGEFMHCYVQNEKMLFLVAEEDKKIIGFLVAMKIINGNTHPLVFHHSWLNLIHYWAPESNDFDSLFSLFIREVLIFAKENNIQRIYIEFEHNNSNLEKVLHSNLFNPMWKKYYFDLK